MISCTTSVLSSFIWLLYMEALSLKVKTDLTYYNLQKEVVLSILH